MNMSRKVIVCLPLFSLALFSCAFISQVEAVTPNASLFFDIANKTINKGDEVTVSIRVNTGNRPVNAVSGSFKIPKNFELQSIETTDSILDFWVNEPKALNNVVSFQGVAVKKSYQGANGLIFTIRGIATASPTLTFNFSEGSVLSDDGLGTNVLGLLNKGLFAVRDIVLVAGTTKPTVVTNNSGVNTTSPNLALNNTPTVTPIIPPVITSISPPIDQSQSFSLLGKGTPNVLTKIDFQDITEPSFGRSFVQSVITDRVKLSDVEIQNDSGGIFSYVSPHNLVTGVYNVVPSYVSPDKAESIVGNGVKVFITENTLSKILIIIINALVLVIPVMTLVLLLIFLPWYFRRRLHVINKKMELEEEKIDAEERALMKNRGQARKIQ
jgi:hypothetical protein